MENIGQIIVNNGARFVHLSKPIPIATPSPQVIKT